MHSSRSKTALSHRLAAVLCVGPLLLLGAALTCGADDGTKPLPKAPDKPAPLMQQFCLPCHSAKQPAGGVNLSTLADANGLQKDPTLGRRVLAQIRDRAMPPQNAPQPNDTQRKQMTDWLTNGLTAANATNAPRNPGRTLIRRLSRTEYNNTVRDLFGNTSKPADSFPADGGGGGGFDNNADTLFVPPILMERYLRAAGQVLAETKPERIFFVQPGAKLSKRDAARKILNAFAYRAFRGPVEPIESERLLRLYDGAMQRGEGFQGAVKFALKAVLVSPRFLFRIEADIGSSAPAPVSDYELASRLSYFLWSSTPDEELLQCAAKNRLHEPATLEKQARRMLQSPKSRALAESFAAQWLRVGDLNTVIRPDPRRFPEYTPALRDAMVQEAIAFFDSLLRDQASMLNLLDADYTYLNETLAKHYGIPNVTGPQMRRVMLTDRRRGGVLTMASVLTLTSYAQRTSPVLRGKWVLEEIFGTPSPPPPPNAGGLPAEDKPHNGLTFRQQLEKHRSRPECASCHSRMDPIGFGLENFDAIGRWRETIGGTPVDASGTLISGAKFTGPLELKACLLAQKETFVHNLTEKMLAYALGRGLEAYDVPTTDHITAALKKNDYRMNTLFLEIVQSFPFRYRKNHD